MLGATTNSGSGTSGSVLAGMNWAVAQKCAVISMSLGAQMIKSGTSMATPHVAGCAALFAQLSPSVRGVALRNRLLGAARHLAFPAAKVGKGLVQAR